MKKLFRFSTEWLAFQSWGRLKTGTSSLELMRREIEEQAKGLRAFGERLNKLSKSWDPSNLAFAGSGDSYSAALWAQELSSGRAVAYDPSELALDPSRVKGKDIVLLSVSGKTRSNLQLAKSLGGVASKRIAITGSKDSPLSRECDETILLSYHHADGLTSGTASYTATLLACAHPLGQVPTLRVEHLVKAARLDTDRRDFFLPKDATVVFVGSGLDYPLAIYGGLKVNEVLGLKSIWCTPEQLVHAIVFSLDKTKDRIVLIEPYSNRRVREIVRALSDIGFSIYSFSVPTQNPVIHSIGVAFHLQYFAYNQAIRLGLKECSFLSNEELLDVSSKLIY